MNISRPRCAIVYTPATGLVRFITLPAVLIAGSWLTCAAHAGTMLQPISATSGMGNYNAQYLPAFALDQSGLAATYTSGLTDFDTFTAATNTVSGGSSFNSWYSAQGVLTGNFDFFLGSVVTIESFALWNDPQTAQQGVNSFKLWADDNAAFTSPTLLGNYNALALNSNAANFAQVFAFAPTAASYVRMEILSNYGSTFVTGFVEAAFEETVPTPATLALLGLGGLIGSANRRRRHAG